MKNKGLKGTIAALLVAIAGFLGYQFNQGFGSAYITSEVTLAGSASNAVRLPPSFDSKDATTTNAALTDGGDTITQLVTTGGIDSVVLYIDAVGGRSTSTLFVRPQISYDGTSYYDLLGSATTSDAVGTTTYDLSPFVFSYDPGLSTTSIATPRFDTRGADFMRFLFQGEDTAGDPSDFVQAHIRAVLIEGTSH